MTNKADYGSTLRALLVLGFACVVLQVSHVALISAVPFEFKFEKSRFILKPDIARALSLGFTRVFADLNWISFVQYYGDRRVVQEGFKFAPDFLKLIIELDPHFQAPYWFASFILAGELHDTKSAKDILDTGISKNPDNWNLYYIAGFNQYMYGYDKAKARENDPAALTQRRLSEDKAAKYYEEGSKIPGAPEWLKGFAKIMRSHALDLVSEIRVWEKTFNTSDSVAVRQHAIEQLQQLYSILYYISPKESYRDRATRGLKQLEVPLLKESELPSNWQENKL